MKLLVILFLLKIYQIHDQLITLIYHMHVPLKLMLKSIFLFTTDFLKVAI